MTNIPSSDSVTGIHSTSADLGQVELNIDTGPRTGPGTDQRPGVMIPIPQYPLYSASLAEYNMEQAGYYLDEARNWALDVAELERSYNANKDKCEIKAIVIINPGNPTG